jgi:hypothetical protein
MTDQVSAVLQRIEKIRQLYSRFLHKIFKVSTGGPMLPLDCQGQAVNDLIRQWLESGAPLMVSRLGRVEMGAVLRYLNMQAPGNFLTRLARYLFQGSGPFWWDDEVRFSMQNNAGFFPASDEHLSRFARRMLQDIQGLDILSSCCPGEIRLRERFPQAKITPLPDLEPYYHIDPWSQGLEGKRVLVIHPYQASIRSQYARRSVLFRDPKVLPEFELLTLKAVQSIGGATTGYKDWFEALDWMCEQIASLDFDVAIIGAGAYSLPLAAFVKKLGKQGFHLGGATQILFGIRGSRWDRMPFFQQLYNEYWVRPSPEETPQNYKSVESGCYW